MIHLQDNAYKKVPTSTGRLLMYTMIGNLCLQFLWNFFCKIYKTWGKKYLFSPLSCYEYTAIVKPPTLQKTLKSLCNQNVCNNT